MPKSRRDGLKLLEQSHAAFEEAIRTLTEAVQRYPDRAAGRRGPLPDCRRRIATAPSGRASGWRA